MVLGLITDYHYRFRVMSVIIWGIWSVWSWGRPKKAPFFFLFWNSLWYDACYDPWVRSQLFTSTTRGGLEASGLQSGFFVDFYVLKISEQMQACLSDQRCHDGPSHALLEYVGMWRLCDVLSAQESGDGMGTPPSRAIWMPQIFPQIFCVFFLRDSGIPIFKRQNVEEKSAPQKSAQKSAHQDYAQKNHFAHCRKPFRTFRFSRRWKPEKKNTRKICAKLARNPSPKRPRERGGGKGAPCLPKTLQDLPSQQPTTMRTPWPRPRPFLWA